MKKNKQLSNNSSTILKVIVICLLIFILIPISIFIFWDTSSYFSPDDVKSALKKIPNITVRYVYGNDNITGSIQVKEKGPLTFFDLQREAFSKTDKLFLTQVGPWGIYGYSLTYDKDGREYKQLARFFMPITGIISRDIDPFPQVNNIYEVVDNYDAILKAIEDLPLRGKGDCKQLSAISDNDMYYCKIPFDEQGVKELLNQLNSESGSK